VQATRRQVVRPESLDGSLLGGHFRTVPATATVFKKGEKRSQKSAERFYFGENALETRTASSFRESEGHFPRRIRSLNKTLCTITSIEI